MLSCRSLFALLAPALLTSCSESPQRPPEVCRAGAASPDSGWFTDVSDGDRDDWGLRALGVRGNRLSVTDLDGDGWPDLAVGHNSSGLRDDFAADGPRYRFVLRNQAGAGFTDVTASSGISATRDGAGGRAWSFALWGDVDNDGDLDAVTVTEAWDVDADHPDLGDRTEVLLNTDGAFALPTWDEELHSELQADWRHTTAAALLDADRDGRLDLFTGNQYAVFGYASQAEQDELYLGKADGRFRRRTDDAGIELPQNPSSTAAHAAEYSAEDGAGVRQPSFGALSCDVDGDGDPDLLTMSYGRAPNQYYDNDGQGTFTNVTAGSGLAHDDGEDYTDNEFFRCSCQDDPSAPDCAGVDSPRVSCQPGMWSAGWDDQPHRLGGNTFGAVCADLDGDGDLDIATAGIRHWWAGSSSDASTILWNEGGSPATFRHADAGAGLERDHDTTTWDEGDLNVGAFDLDNDGVTDLLRPQSDYDGTRMHLYRGLGAGRFEEAAEALGLAFPRAAGFAVADFDHDGDLDVATSFSRMRCDADCPYSTAEVHLFRNDVGQDRNALRLRLRGGEGSTRDAIGARVTVRAGDLTQVQELRAGYGHQGLQDELVLHFGLGDRCQVDEVEVRWPDSQGTTERWTALPANYLTVLTQGVDEPQWPDWTP